MERRSIYDVTSEEDRREAAELIRAGEAGFALLVPEDLPLSDLKALFEAAGFRVEAVDSKRWPSEVVVATSAGIYALEKIEEGVYRLTRT
ncbi:MAG: hypothetical protein TU35_005995 [Thermoproteus sp. AZ2]|uniref:Uncharacterized protein n=1 Tax=Thermoproteus sp. AZ2 TaxID=1609232 RepID=A0ACC6V155_9CREN|nr:MAG: hypothetical protein TU35_03745 [Thermoproteus sp. AZ2]